jgi:hypothetical protein
MYASPFLKKASCYYNLTTAAEAGYLVIMAYAIVIQVVILIFSAVLKPDIQAYSGINPTQKRVLNPGRYTAA